MSSSWSKEQQQVVAGGGTAAAASVIPVNPFDQVIEQQQQHADEDHSESVLVSDSFEKDAAIEGMDGNDVAMALGNTLDSFAKAIDDLNQEFERSINEHSISEKDDEFSCWNEVEKHRHDDDDDDDDDDERMGEDQPPPRPSKKTTGQQRPSRRRRRKKGEELDKDEKSDNDDNNNMIETSSMEDLNEEFERSLKEKSEFSCWNEVEKHRRNATNNSDNSDEDQPNKKKTEQRSGRRRRRKKGEEFDGEKSDNDDNNMIETSSMEDLNEEFERSITEKGEFSCWNQVEKHGRDNIGGSDEGGGGGVQPRKNKTTGQQRPGRRRRREKEEVDDDEKSDNDDNGNNNMIETSSMEDLNEEFERSITEKGEFSCWNEVEKHRRDNIGGSDEGGGGVDPSKNKTTTGQQHPGRNSSRHSDDDDNILETKSVDDLNEEFERTINDNKTEKDGFSCWNEVEKRRRRGTTDTDEGGGAEKADDQPIIKKAAETLGGSTTTGGDGAKKKKKPGGRPGGSSSNDSNTKIDDNYSIWNEIEKFDMSNSNQAAGDGGQDDEQSSSKKKTGRPGVSSSGGSMNRQRRRRPPPPTTSTNDTTRSVSTTTTSTSNTEKKSPRSKKASISSSSMNHHGNNKEKKSAVNPKKKSSNSTSTSSGNKSKSGLSELSKQLRLLTAKNDKQSVQIERLEKKLSIMSDLQNVSVGELRTALDRACQDKAHEELQLQVKELKAQAVINAGSSRARGAGSASSHQLQAQQQQIAQLELRCGELEEIEQSKQEEIDRLYQLLEGRQQGDDSTANIWKKRFESAEEQSKLKLSQQQARMWVMEENLRDTNQQLSSLYEAFSVVQKDHDCERTMLESSLQDADAEVAQQVHKSFENNNRREGRAAPTSSPTPPSSAVAAAVTPATRTAVPPATTMTEPLVAVASPFPSSEQPASPYSTSYSISSPRQQQLSSPFPSSRSIVSTAATYPSSSRQLDFTDGGTATSSNINTASADQDNEPLLRGRLLIRSGGGLLPKRWHDRPAVLYPATDSNSDSGALLVLNTTHQYRLRPNDVTRIGHYTKQRYGMVLCLRNKSSLYLAARNETEYRQWREVFAACLGTDLLQDDAEVTTSSDVVTEDQTSESHFYHYQEQDDDEDLARALRASTMDMNRIT